jgi:hypothetical protein
MWLQGFHPVNRAAIFPLQKIERRDSIPSCCTSPRKLRLCVQEVSAAWSHREGTRINPWHDGIRMFGEVLSIRWNALSGKYSTNPPQSEVLQPVLCLRQQNRGFSIRVL